MKPSPAAISLRNISKCFKTYAKPSDRLLELFLPHRVNAHEFWAVRNLDLDIAKGKTVGIVGRNGSGKSTLLRMIAGTLTPTSGTLSTQGRIAALLELGSGFNPEFTGRQNVFFNGQILGLSQPQIEALLDSILAFAEIGEFIDRPVKTYSSGMSVRLAFAVATAQAPEILIIDEALSVGDEAFQRKCFARLREIQEGGSTILFVSHSAASITELCDAAILMDRGELLLQGHPKLVITEYQKLAYAPTSQLQPLREQIRVMQQRLREAILAEESLTHSSPSLDGQAAKVQAAGPPQQTIARASSSAEQIVQAAVSPIDKSSPIAPSAIQPAVPPSEIAAGFDPNLLPKSTVSYVSRGASIQTPQLLTLTGQPANLLTMGQDYLYRYRVVFERSAAHVRCGILIKTVSGLELGGSVTHTRTQPLLSAAAGSEFDVEFKFRCLLKPGAYFLNAGVLGKIEGQEVFLARKIDAAMFRVQPVRESQVTGIVDFCMSSRMTLTAHHTAEQGEAEQDEGTCSGESLAISEC